jgi:hypothetical protein
MAGTFPGLRRAEFVHISLRHCFLDRIVLSLMERTDAAISWPNF